MLCRLLAVPLALVVVALCSSTIYAADSPKLKGLLITGGCCHDYPKQTLIITEGMSQRVNIGWTVFHAGKSQELVEFFKQPDWIKGYDVVVHNQCHADIADQALVESVQQAHAGTGTPAIVIHCAMHTFRSLKSDEWRSLLGVTSTYHEKGGRKLDVKNAAPEHPIMQGFPRMWQTPNGELYVVLKAGEKATPLATAYGEDTKKDQMCIWTNEVGKARVFGTTLGHFNEEMLSPEWLDVTARGLLWCVGKLNQDGTPPEGYAGTGVTSFSFEKKTDPAKQPTPAEKPAAEKPKTDAKTSAALARSGGTFTVALADAAADPAKGLVAEAVDWSSTVKFPEGEKPVALFNGKNLDGWGGHKDKYFSVVDGVIVAKNTAENAPKVSTYLLTEKKYRNFRLVFEGKLVQSQMHSGIAIWGKQHEVGDEKISYQGHLVMFPTHWGFWDLYRRNGIYSDDGRAKKADNVGGWNKMEILAIGSRIQLAVNGKPAADWTDPKPELCGEGPLGLQLHSNSVPQEVHFRGLILAENPGEALITVAK